MRLKKKGLLIGTLIVSILILSIVLYNEIVMPIVRYVGYKIDLAEEKRRVEEIANQYNIALSDMIIAFSHTSCSATYVFAFSGNHKMEAFYGNRMGGEGEEYRCITTVDFMQTVDISKSIVLPDNVYSDILTLADEILEEKLGYFALSCDGWDTIIIKDGIIYEVIYGSDHKLFKLGQMLQEYSPIVVELGWTGGRAEIKEEYMPPVLTQ